VAGAAGLSLMTVDPAEIGDTYEPNSVGETILLTPGGAPIQLTALQVCISLVKFLGVVG
jgi:hypothetical protein